MLWWLRSVLLVLLAVPSVCVAQSGFEPLFNGRDFSGWRIVNTAPSTWIVDDGMIVTTGKPIGELCTTEQYENFILEIEWRHMVAGGNAGLFIHSDPLPAVGQPFTRAIENQVMDGNHGDVFAIHGAVMTPDRPHPEGWMRSLPIEKRANPTGEWNHYRVESRDGSVTLAVNGKDVSGGYEVSPRKGYICLESEGSEAHFRNIRIRKLPSTNPEPEAVADTYQGFRTLYNGVDLSGWRGRAAIPWQVDDWVLRHSGAASSGRHLWTEEEFDDFELIVDFKLNCEALSGRSHTALLLRGTEEAQLPVGCSDALSDAAPFAVDESRANARGWQRVHARVIDNQADVSINGQRFARLSFPVATPQQGPVGLADFGAPVQVANLFIKELNP